VDLHVAAREDVHPRGLRISRAPAALLDRDMRTEPNNARSLDRRRVYIGEGLSFQIESETAWLEAEAIDLTHEGLGVAVVLATDVMLPPVGEVVTVR
jgi:hypothetical protein